MTSPKHYARWGAFVMLSGLSMAFTLLASGSDIERTFWGIVALTIWSLLSGLVFGFKARRRIGGKILFAFSLILLLCLAGMVVYLHHNDDFFRSIPQEGICPV